jgi:hypothetical protein
MPKFNFATMCLFRFVMPALYYRTRHHANAALRYIDLTIKIAPQL